MYSLKRGGGGMPRLRLRSRADQSIWLPGFVTVMMVVYVWLVWVEAGFGVHFRVAVGLGVMSVGCLWGVVSRDPGEVGRGWRPPEGGGWERVVLESSYCRVCDGFRPPRAHHCSYCKRCFERYDHHCDWVDNCIAANNHKLFVLFMLYVTPTPYHFFFLLIRHFLSPTPHVPTHPNIFVSLTLLFIFAIYTLLALGLLLFSTVFLYITLKQLILNQTTIESDFTPGFPYYKNAYRNIAEVMGANPLLWPIPVVNNKLTAWEDLV